MYPYYCCYIKKIGRDITKLNFQFEIPSLRLCYTGAGGAGQGNDIPRAGRGRQSPIILWNLFDWNSMSTWRLSSCRCVFQREHAVLLLPYRFVSKCMEFSLNARKCQWAWDGWNRVRGDSAFASYQCISTMVRLQCLRTYFVVQKVAGFNFYWKSGEKTCHFGLLCYKPRGAGWRYWHRIDITYLAVICASLEHRQTIYRAVGIYAMLSKQK